MPVPPKQKVLVRKLIGVQLDTAPLRLLNTATEVLSDRDAQISAFKRSTEYNELLLSLIMKHADLRILMQRIEEAVATYFRCVILSHRWEVSTNGIIPVDKRQPMTSLANLQWGYNSYPRNSLSLIIPQGTAGTGKVYVRVHHPMNSLEQ
ncbi:hypothetical protein EDB19DRAFT_1910502 [Suillus lakei]|nr:hypothetical protein EDB19DRAFT_1910502 [Suillus lakei]